MWGKEAKGAPDLGREYCVDIRSCEADQYLGILQQDQPHQLDPIHLGESNYQLAQRLGGPWAAKPPRH